MWLDDYTYLHRVFELAKQQNEMSAKVYFDVSLQLFLAPTSNLSNVKICFYPKNTTSRLQAMDQDVIATLKKSYNKRMLNVARIKAKTTQSVIEIVKDIKIFDAILHVIVAWSSIELKTIVKCFRHCGI